MSDQVTPWFGAQAWGSLLDPQPSSSPLSLEHLLPYLFFFFFLLHLKSFFLIIYLFYIISTPTWGLNSCPEIQSHELFGLSQPGTPAPEIFNSVSPVVTKSSQPSMELVTHWLVDG